MWRTHNAFSTVGTQREMQRKNEAVAQQLHLSSQRKRSPASCGRQKLSRLHGSGKVGGGGLWVESWEGGWEGECRTRWM